MFQEFQSSITSVLGEFFFYILDFQQVKYQLFIPKTYLLLPVVVSLVNLVYITVKYSLSMAITSLLAINIGIVDYLEKIGSLDANQAICSWYISRSGGKRSLSHLGQ